MNLISLLHNVNFWLDQYQKLKLKDFEKYIK